MARYMLLTDHFLPGGAYAPAGSIVSTVDVGGTLPVGWISNAVDPLDAAAVQVFWQAGPQTMPLLVRQCWSGVPVSAPVTYWRALPGNTTMWQLTGLGAGLPPIGI
jgi:hypothetical protein